MSEELTPDSVLASEIAAEQQYVDEVYVQLEVSTQSAMALAQEGRNRGRLEHEGGLVERDAMVFQAAKRIAQLDAAHEGLVFGRLDLDPSIDPEPRYIGRIGVRNADRDVLLIDWRAPAAGVFYQATAAEPHDVVRRRVLRCAGPQVVGVEDELLDAAAMERSEVDLPIVGEGALMAQLSRARDRSMHSIVATIQAEQDQAIRAPGEVSTMRWVVRRSAAARSVPVLSRSIATSTIGASAYWPATTAGLWVPSGSGFKRRRMVSVQGSRLRRSERAVSLTCARSRRSLASCAAVW